MSESIAGFYGGWLSRPLDEVGPEVLNDIVAAHGDVGPFVCPAPSQYAKWIASSSLQKSIRRGLDERARWHCDQLLQIDPYYMFRRLHTVAVEDVGIANILMLAAYATGGGSKTWQSKMGGRTTVARALVTELAVSPKDRLGDELKTLDLRERQDSEKWNREVADLPDDELMQILQDRQEGLTHRALALMYLTRFEPSDRNALVPRIAPKKNWRTALMEVCTVLKTPLLLRELCWVYAGRMMERQAYCLPLAWDLMKDEQWRVEDDAGIVDEVAGSWPAVAIDGHTSQGKKAIAKLIKRDSLAQELNEQHVIGPDWAPRAFHLTFFRTEGHLCRQRLAAGISEIVRAQSSVAVVSQYCRSKADGEAMLAHGPELLDRLQLIRQKMMAK